MSSLTAALLQFRLNLNRLLAAPTTRLSNTLLSPVQLFGEDEPTEPSSSTGLRPDRIDETKIMAIYEQVNTLAQYIRLRKLTKQACGQAVYLVICHR